MDALIALGRSVAPFAIECTVTISLAALAGLLAARILGRQPGRAFAFLAAAFVLGAALLVERDHPESQVQAFDPLAVMPPPAHIRTSVPPTDTPSPTTVPGLVAKYGSLFQVRFSGVFPQGEATPPAPGFEGWGWLGLLWLLGLGALTLHQVTGLVSVRTTLEASRPCTDRRLLHAAACIRDGLGTSPVALRLSSTRRCAFVVGIAHPCIVLPKEALGWTDDRLTATLSHEYLHVRRRDIFVTQGLRLVAALAWCSPLPWLALSRALKLREEVCDQAVLRSGTRPTDYAASLLAAARSTAPTLPATAASMATGSDLERRILGILEPPHPGRQLLRNASAMAVLVALGGTHPITEPLYAHLESAARAPRSAAIGWPAFQDPAGERVSTQGSYSLAKGDDYTRIRLVLNGRTSIFRVPTVAVPSRLPLSSRARMILPFGELVDAHSARTLTHPGWTLWDDRLEPARAASAGRVARVRLDPREGMTVDVDHGAGLRTRYGLGRWGVSLVQAGEFVAAGTPLGAFGEISPTDLPALGFGILVQAHGEWVALDPAPFLLSSDPQRNTPLAASVLNASVRLGDRAEVRRLLASGLSPNGISGDGTLPLEWVILNRDLVLARDLLAAGADPSAPTWNTHQAHIALHGPTVAELARETGDPALVALLSRLEAP